LASGRPVVGSPIRSLKDFEHVIVLATAVDEWSAALTRSLAPAASAPAAAAARQAVARENDWSEITCRVARTICERLNPELAPRIEKLTIGTPNFSHAG
jgi:hypothetical protein